MYDTRNVATECINLLDFPPGFSQILMFNTAQGFMGAKYFK